MQDTATQTLLALEQRLHRLAFLLHGDPADNDAVDSTPSDPSGSSGAISSRLQNIERSLQTIATQSNSAAELLRLQKQHPDLWEDVDTDKPGDDIPEDALAALVLAHVPSYHTTAAQLTSLNDLPVPDASSSAALLSLEPRIQKVRERQEQQARLVDELRQKSVSLVGRWYELGIVSMGDCWSEWDARLMDAERTIRQTEARKQRETEALS